MRDQGGTKTMVGWSSHAEASVGWRSQCATALWFGEPDRPLLGWLNQPASGAGATGVVLIPPLGYEYWTTHRALRAVAERLAAQGCSVLRFDLAGTGDSAGAPSDPAQLANWRHSVQQAAATLRAGGSTSLVLAGVRFGATLALLEGAAVGADRIVAWAPVERGRGYVRELKLLGRPIPDDVAGTGGGISHAGSAFSPETLAAIGDVDVQDLDGPPARRILVVDRDDRAPSDRLLDRLRVVATATEHLVVPGTAVALDLPAEYADVPDAVVQSISTWVGRSAPGGVATSTPGASEAVIGQVTERVLRLGPDRLVGIETVPANAPRATVVWCNSGSEPHVGPGRAWVEYARAIAVDGYASVRFDFSGWGESPDLRHAPGRPYDPHCIEEVSEVVDDLRRRGHRRIVVAGLCAGAWVALRAALTQPLDGVIAINPQLYWQPGDPVEADIVSETRVRRTGEIEQFKKGRRSGKWTVLDMVGVRHPAATWLRDLERTGIPVLALFAEGDDGLEFLDDRVGRSWARCKRHGTVTQRVVSGIDHPMHRTWLRDSVVDEVRAWLDALVGDDEATSRT